jgi:hypothetical protein
MTSWNRQGTPPESGVHPVLLASGVIPGMELPTARRWDGEKWHGWQCDPDPLPPLPVVAWGPRMPSMPAALAWSHLNDPARLARERGQS